MILGSLRSLGSFKLSYWVDSTLEQLGDVTHFPVRLGKDLLPSIVSIGLDGKLAESSGGCVFMMAASSTVGGEANTDVSPAKVSSGPVVSPELGIVFTEGPVTNSKP